MANQPSKFTRQSSFAEEFDERLDLYLKNMLLSSGLRAA